MNDPFFINKGKPTKRKRPTPTSQKRPIDEDIEEEDLSPDERQEDEFDDQERETAEEKRLRLSRAFLDKMETETQRLDDQIDAAELDREIIASRLHQDALEARGKAFHAIANKFEDWQGQVHLWKHHKESVTCVAVGKRGDEIVICSGGKDGAIAKWDIEGNLLNHVPGGLKKTKKLMRVLGRTKLAPHKGHQDHILAMDISSDGKFLAVGGKDKIVTIWNTDNLNLLSTFSQHRDSVSALKFRKGQNQLYTASFDRTVKVWNIDELSYLDTMFGHQDVICNMDALQRERCVTAGARDRTVRLWKIPEETQLVFRGGGGGLDEVDEAKKKVQNAFGGSLDVVCMLNEDYFVTGSDNGALSLWSVGKKKPVFTRLRAHGKKEHQEHELDPHYLSTVEGEEFCNWITSLAAVPYSDLFASGSSDGFIKLWKVDPEFKSFSLVSSIPVKGFINDLKFLEVHPSVSAREPLATTAAERRVAARRKMQELQTENVDAPILYLFAAVGQEHRLGRWFRVKGSKNYVAMMNLGEMNLH